MYFHRVYLEFVYCQLYHRVNGEKKGIFVYEYEYLY